MSRFAYIFVLALLSGCGINSLLPKTIGEASSGFTYVPLDPLETYAYPDQRTCKYDDDYKLSEGYSYRQLLDDFSDVAVRLSIVSKDAKAGASFGTSSLGVAGNSYRVTLDYVNSLSTTIPFTIKIQEVKGQRRYTVSRLDVGPRSDASDTTPRTGASPNESTTGYEINSEYSIPVYIGVGLRLTADIEVRSGSVNLASLGSIAASVEANDTVGSLTVQTLGINGEKIALNIPLPSKLNQTTIENALLSIGGIKALTYDDSVNITARVTGIYLPVRDGSIELINLITSELAKEAISWDRTCQFTKPPEDSA